MPRLCDLYPGICFTTEEKARKNLSQGSRRMAVGKEYTEQSILAGLLGCLMLLLLLSFLEQKIRFTLPIDSDVHGGFIVQTHEH